MVTEDFEQARAAADAVADYKVGGTYKTDGTPVYFLHPEAASDDEIHDMAFQIRHGRPINAYERWGIQVAKSLAEQGVEL